MIEKVKTGLLAALVVISLIQSYFLAYSMPGLGATVSPQQDYVPAAPMGAEEKVENVVFPEDMVLHLGKGKHTVLYPATNFYNRIYERIQSREFKGFEQSKAASVDWTEVRDRDQGLELRFGQPVPVQLLTKSLKIEGNPQFMSSSIDRIWIFKDENRDEVRTYFFSGDSSSVYESVGADLTAQDLQTYIGFGEYMTLYEPLDGGLYVPTVPIESVETLVGYDRYTPEQMQHNLFFDPSVTRAISDRSGSQIYTDGKKGLQVEQNGKWISYTDPVAGQGTDDSESENVYTSVAFINEHGGWDGMHRLLQVEQSDDNDDSDGGQMIRFQQYYTVQFYGAYPIVANPPFLFGEIRLRVQQGVVSDYERTLITLNKKAQSRNERWLPGGNQLTDALAAYPKRSEVTALYPALSALPVAEGMMQLEPVWAVRLEDGTKDVLLDAMPAGYQPPSAPAGGPEPGLSQGSASGGAEGGAAAGSSGGGKVAKTGVGGSSG